MVFHCIAAERFSLGLGSPLSPNRIPRGLALWGYYIKGVNTMIAIGFVEKQSDGGFRGQLKTVSIQAEIEIVLNDQKSSATQPDYRVLTGDIEIGAGWLKTASSSGKDYVSLSLTAPEFGTSRLYANLGQAAGSDDPDVFAIIWNPTD